jgi:flagellin
MLIGTTPSQYLSRQVDRSSKAVSDLTGELSSGSRVPNVRYDSASLALGSRLNFSSRLLTSLKPNIATGQALLQVADGVYNSVQKILGRMKELASQAGSANLSNTERAFLNQEYQQLMTESDRVVKSAKFNGQPIFPPLLGFFRKDLCRAHPPACLATMIPV